MYPKRPCPSPGRDGSPAAKSLLRRSVGAAVALTIVGGCLFLLPDQPVAPQPEAAPPASVVPVVLLRAGLTAEDAIEHTGAQLADAGFDAIWLLPLAGGLIILGVLFAVFASRKQRRDEEQLAAEQAELARQEAIEEQADRDALAELEELDRARQRFDLPTFPTGPHDRVHPIEPHGPGRRVGPFVSFPDDRVGPETGADSAEENGKRPEAH